MKTFILRRILQMLLTLWVISVISFIAIQLPPGDFLERKIHQLEQQGTRVNLEAAERLSKYYGLDKPYAEQYWLWITRFIQGDFGRSFLHEQSVNDLIGERLRLTLILGITSLIFSYVMAIILGMISVAKKYSFIDYSLTTLSFIGLSTPNFLLALILLVISVFFLDIRSLTGLFSPEFRDAPWSFAKVIDLGKHIWLPMILISASNIGGLLRIMRGSLLEVMGEDFVTVAHAKGLKPRIVFSRHVLKIAINPLISIAGMQIPNIISGEILVAVVLNLPTIGPLFLEALRYQDMFLAGSLLMIMAIMLVVGNFIADLVLAWSDPRIRYE